MGLEFEAMSDKLIVVLVMLGESVGFNEVRRCALESNRTELDEGVDVRQSAVTVLSRA